MCYKENIYIYIFIHIYVPKKYLLQWEMFFRIHALWQPNTHMSPGCISIIYTALNREKTDESGSVTTE